MVVSAAATNVCCEQPIYGDGVGVSIVLKPNVVAGVGLGFSSGVGLGVASGCGLPRCPAPTERCACGTAPCAPWLCCAACLCCALWLCFACALPPLLL